MIYTRLVGGLGNQLFQYAAGLALAQRHRTECILDVSAFDVYLLHKFSLYHFDLKVSNGNQVRNHKASFANRTTKGYIPLEEKVSSFSRGAISLRQPL